VNLPGNYSAHGRVHRILDRLAQASCKVGHVMAAIGYRNPVSNGVRKKFWRLIDHLKDHGLVEPRDGVWAITDAGLDVLRYLDAMHGQCPPPGSVEPEEEARPSVRIFVREVAA